MHRVEQSMGYYLIIFDGDGDLPQIEEYNFPPEKTVYVCLEGTSYGNLPRDRFVVENSEESLENHFLWEGIITLEAQNAYIHTLVEKFIETGEQIIIEHYDFVDDEPFFDYTR